MGTFSFALTKFSFLSFSFSFLSFEVAETTTFAEAFLTFKSTNVHRRRTLIRRRSTGKYVPRLMILNDRCSNLLISSQGARIQPQVRLQGSTGFVQQSSNKHTIRKCCPSLPFILHLDGFPSVEVLLRGLGIEPELKKLSQQRNMPGCIRKCKLLHQATPSLKTIRIIILTRNKSCSISCQVRQQVMQLATESHAGCCGSSVNRSDTLSIHNCHIQSLICHLNRIKFMRIKERCCLGIKHC